MIETATPGWAERLKAAREAAALTKRELSERLDIPVTTYAGYEAGTREPRFSAVVQLCDVLGITPDHLFLGSSVSPSGGLAADLNARQMKALRAFVAAMQSGDG